MPIPTIGYALQEPGGPLQPWKFEQRDLGPHDVHIRIVACGVCNTDVHMGRNDWGISTFPMVPGHEIAGYIEAVGENVVKFKPGDKAGVGILFDSCRICDSCVQNKAQYCLKRVFANTPALKEGVTHHGGYARDVVCDERFVSLFPEGLDLYTGSALLCAGITVYSPMKKFGMDKPGKKLGVIGLGGLGHMAVKLGVAFGLEVTVLSRSESKREEALGILGAQKFLNTSDKATLEESKDALDFIIDTVGAPKDMNLYLSLLTTDGIMVMVAIPDPGNILQINALLLIDSRRILTGSVVGSVEETEEMLKFCADANVTAMIEKIPMDYVNTAWERILKSDVHYRFVMDVENTCPKV